MRQGTGGAGAVRDGDAIRGHVEDVPESEMYTRMASPEHEESMRVSTGTLDGFMRSVRGAGVA
ncbi:hypothetical protein [Polymorphospora rubra]|uniref:hypothetical protein n=1 Tax=Polymorphospora rubra TaxID=338584 RepID=UPI0033DFB098